MRIMHIMRIELPVCFFMRISCIFYAYSEKIFPHLRILRKLRFLHMMRITSIMRITYKMHISCVFHTSAYNEYYAYYV
jgi:hypothetical protein